jgi:hypothetical protein
MPRFKLKTAMPTGFQMVYFHAKNSNQGYGGPWNGKYLVYYKSIWNIYDKMVILWPFGIFSTFFGLLYQEIWQP